MLCLVLVARAASGPSVFVRASEGIGSSSAYPVWLAGPLRGLASPLTTPGWIALLALLTVLYGLSLALSRHVPPVWAVASVVVAHVAFALGPPLWLSDVFNYIGFARLGATHGLDPYSHTLGALGHDPAHALSTWRRIASPYGPLFTVASYPLAAVGIATATWATKIVSVGTSLVCLFLVWRLAQLLKRPPVPALMFVGLNPLWLVFEVGGAHNDALALALALTAVLLLVRGHDRAAGALAVTAAAVKVTLGLALPFLWVASSRRGRVVVGAAAALVAVGVLSLAVFGEVTSALGAFANQGSYVSLRSVPGQVSAGILSVGTIPQGLAIGALIAFGAVALALLVMVARGADWVGGLGWATLALLLSLTWLMPWYAAWLLPFAALAEGRRLRGAALLLTAFLLVVRMPYPVTA